MLIWIDDTDIETPQARSAGVQPRLEKQWQCQAPTRYKISPCIECFINLRDDDASEYCNPYERITPCEYLVAVLAGLDGGMGKLEWQWKIPDNDDLLRSMLFGLVLASQYLVRWNL